MAKSYNVAVVGATGIVGQELLSILTKRSFPLASLRLIASARSAGRKVALGEQEIEVEALSHDCFENCDFVFNAVPDEISREYSSRDHSILRAPIPVFTGRRPPCAWFSERAAQRLSPLSRSRRGTPSRGACPPELDPIAQTGVQIDIEHCPTAAAP